MPREKFVQANNQMVRIDSHTSRSLDLTILFTSFARLILLVCVVVLPWLIGGYYPLSRFACLGMLCCVMTVLWMTPERLTSTVGRLRHKPLLFVCLGMLILGLVQLFPIEPFGDWTGVGDIRRTFSDSERVTQPLTLSTWETKTWLAMSSIGVAGFFLSSVLFNTERSQFILMISLSLSGAGQVFWGIVQSVRFPGLIFWGMENPAGSTPFGTFLNRNHGADFVGMALACSAGLLWNCHQRSQRQNRQYNTSGEPQRILTNPALASFWFLTIWLATGVIISLSRGAWLSCAIALLSVPLFWVRKQRSSRSLAFPLLATFGLIFVTSGIQLLGMGDRVSGRMDDLQINEVLEDGRLDHWLESLPGIQHFLPFGSGFGTYGFAYLPFSPDPASKWFGSAHNQYLETLMEGGLPAIGLLVTGLVLVFRICRELCSYERETVQQSLGITAMIAFVMQAAHALTDFGLTMPANLLTLAVILGAAQAASTQPNVHPAAAPPRKSKKLSAFLISGVVTLILIVAAAHQINCLRSERLLAATRFSSSTPTPTATTTAAWIRNIEQQSASCVDDFRLLSRLTQLRIHLAQRLSYDQILRGDVLAFQTTDSEIVWSNTTLEAVIATLHDGTLSETQRTEVQQQMRIEPNLAIAWQNVTDAVQLNPLEPRTHLRMALLAAASGRNWKSSLAHSIVLSGADPKLSFANGLLAWAAHDDRSMIAQWSQTIVTAPKTLHSIVPLICLRLSDDEFVSELPGKWNLLYQVATGLRNLDKADLRTRLLQKADAIASKDITSQSAAHKARALIAAELGDSDAAASFHEALVRESPRDPEIRYQYAVALIRAKQASKALDEARIAMRLSGGGEKYSNLFQRARSLFEQQSQ